MSERVSWGVLGNATIARVCVIPALRRARNAEVRALATRSPEKAGPVASENRIERVYDSYQTLLEDPEIDAVYVPLPNHLHHPWTLRALRAGKHVLCEKPLACTAGQAREMGALAAEAGLLLMEAFMYRFHPRNRRIQEMVSRGRIGRPCSVRSAFCFPIGHERIAACDNVRLKPETGGGALLDVGCYGVSVARWLMGAEPTHLQARALFHDNGVDLHFVGTLGFAGWGLATVEASFLSALQQTYTVAGSEGVIELPHDAFVPWDKETVFTLREKEQEVGAAYVTPGADEYQLMVEHFSDAVLGEAELAFSVEESVCNMRVLDGLAEAARTGGTVVL